MNLADGGECKLELFFDPSMPYVIQYSKWYTVWQAVVAINAMCIRNGQSGEWRSLGIDISKSVAHL